MLYGLTSWRNPSASARTACFVAAYTAKSGPILWPATDETKIMCPDFCFFICSRAAAIPYNTPLMLTSIVRSQSSTVRRSSGARGMIPALLIMTSIRPNSCTAVSTNFFTWLRWVTSVATATAFPPLRFNSSANDLRRSERRAPSTTLAPCAERRRAAASPSPLLAPVITTIFPSILLVMLLVSFLAPCFLLVTRLPSRSLGEGWSLVTFSTSRHLLQVLGISSTLHFDL